jgi:hypothetical protein
METQDKRPGHPVAGTFSHMLGGHLLPAGALVLIGIQPNNTGNVVGLLHKFFPYQEGDHYSFTSGKIAGAKYGTDSGPVFAENVADELRESFGEGKGEDVKVCIVDLAGLVFDYPSHGRRALWALKCAARDIDRPVVIITELVDTPRFGGPYRGRYKIGKGLEEVADLELFPEYCPAGTGTGNGPSSHWKVRRGKWLSPEPVKSEAFLWAVVPL